MVEIIRNKATPITVSTRVSPDFFEDEKECIISTSIMTEEGLS